MDTVDNSCIDTSLQLNYFLPIPSLLGILKTDQVTSRAATETHKCPRCARNHSAYCLLSPLPAHYRLCPPRHPLNTLLSRLLGPLPHALKIRNGIGIHPHIVSRLELFASRNPELLGGRGGCRVEIGVESVLSEGEFAGVGVGGWWGGRGVLVWGGHVGGVNAIPFL